MTKLCFYVSLFCLIGNNGYASQPETALAKFDSGKDIFFIEGVHCETQQSPKRNEPQLNKETDSPLLPGSKRPTSLQTFCTRESVSALLTRGPFLATRKQSLTTTSPNGSFATPNR